MYCAALRLPLRHVVASQRRSFVSTVLLTKAWESETINELRREARRRGLSSKGNKATLITRLQKDEHNSAFAPEHVPSTSQVRHASTAPVETLETPTEVPGIPSTAEPMHPKYNLDIQLPNLSTLAPEAPVQIPFVPDLWESSSIKHEVAPAGSAPSTEPKVVVIAGETTLPGAHSVYSPSSSTSYVPEQEDQPRKEPASDVGRLFADMVEDFGLPATGSWLPQSADALYDGAAKTETSGGHGKSYSRTLDEDEKKGVWALFGVLVGSWVAATFFAPVSEWAHKTEAAPRDVQEKTAGKQGH